MLKQLHTTLSSGNGGMGMHHWKKLPWRYIGNNLKCTNMTHSVNFVVPVVHVLYELLWTLILTNLQSWYTAIIHKTVKRFQMKSTGCRDVQHTGLQSTQTRRNYSSNNTSKQDAQTRGHLGEFPSIPTSVAACLFIVGYANHAVKVTTNWQKC